jgi:hypothetical protein
MRCGQGAAQKIGDYARIETAKLLQPFGAACVLIVTSGKAMQPERMRSPASAGCRTI